MKIPNKIYLEVLPYSNSKEVFKDVLKTKRTFEDDIEYIRTDAFIDKACEWLKKNADNYTWYDEFEGESGMIDEFIDDFKNYMKGVENERTSKRI